MMGLGRVEMNPGALFEFLALLQLCVPSPCCPFEDLVLFLSLERCVFVRHQHFNRGIGFAPWVHGIVRCVDPPVVSCLACLVTLVPAVGLFQCFVQILMFMFKEEYTRLANAFYGFGKI